MRPVGAQKPLILLLALILATPLASGLDSDEWPSIDPEELALEENAAEPGSSAMILMKRDLRDDAKGVREVYYRIKILKDSGREYGDIDVPYLSSEKVEDIAARTIQPDGRVIEFRGAIYDKTLIKARKERIQAKSFTLPEVQTGSIIEYKYRKKVKEDLDVPQTWFVQEDLFVRTARLILKPRSGAWRAFGRRLPEGQKRTLSSGRLEATFHDLPPFESEVLMPPARQLKMRYHLIYRSSEYAFSGSVWKEIGDSFADWHGEFIGKPKKLRSIVNQIVSAGDTPEDKARKIYGAIQSRIRNLSYEERYTKKERKRERLKKRKSAVDVWRFGYGHAHEITNLFTAMCRAAELRADTIAISSRDTHFFDRELRDPYQLDDYVAVMDLETGEDPTYLDPGTQLAPFGYVSWEKQGVFGLLLGEKGSREVNTPVLDAADSKRAYRLGVELEADGSACVRMHSRYTGQEALLWRDELSQFSEDQRIRKLHRNLEKYLTAPEISDVVWKGLDDAGDQVELTYTLRLPNYGQVQGKRLVIQSLLWVFHSPFSKTGRKHPVHVPHSFTRLQEVKIVPPPGFHLEVKPEPYQLETPFGDYTSKVTTEDRAVSFRRKLTVRAAMVPQPTYLPLKHFYDAMAAADRGHLVFVQSLQAERHEDAN